MERSSNRVKPEEFRNWNERMLKKYDPDSFHHHSNPLVRFVEQKRVRAIFEFMDIQPQDCILEIGCGAGNVLEKAPTGRLFGVDISFSILMKAKRKLIRTGFLFQGNAQNLPCKNHLFKYVICSEVLEHLLEPTRALEEMARVLKSQGSAIITIPNELWINRIKRFLLKLKMFHFFVNRRGDYQQMPERMDDEWHLHSFHLDGWLQIFKKFFKVNSRKSIPFWWLPLRFVIRLEREE